MYRYTKERNINELRHNSMYGYENNRNSPVYRYTRTAPIKWYISVFKKLSDLTFENLKATLSCLKVKEIQTRAQFCVSISMYFIDKIIQ